MDAWWQRMIVVAAVVTGPCYGCSTQGARQETRDGGILEESGRDASIVDAISETNLRSGCDPTATSKASVLGTLQGRSLTAKDAFTIQTIAAGTYTTSVGVVDYPGACLLSPTHSLKANANVLALHFVASGPLSAGMFTVPNTVNAQFASYDQTCTPTGESAGSGSVQITQANDCGLTGTFDLMMNADHVTGSFFAPTCNPVSSDGGQCL